MCGVFHFLEAVTKKKSCLQANLSNYGTITYLINLNYSSSWWIVYASIPLQNAKKKSFPWNSQQSSNRLKLLEQNTPRKKISEHLQTNLYPFQIILRLLRPVSTYGNSPSLTVHFDAKKQVCILSFLFIRCLLFF